MTWKKMLNVEQERVVEVTCPCSCGRKNGKTRNGSWKNPWESEGTGEYAQGRRRNQQKGERSVGKV